MERWEANIALMENMVHASFLVDAAKKAGIAVEKVRQCPFFTSVTKDQASQASFPCRACVALETSMTSLDDDDSLQGEKEPSLQDGDEGQSQQPLFGQENLCHCCYLNDLDTLFCPIIVNMYYSESLFPILYYMHLFFGFMIKRNG